jgi:hypothetical protein
MLLLCGILIKISHNLMQTEAPMSGHAAYEVQGYAGGVWRTLRVCGDADDAVAEAKGTRDNRKYLSVRVTAEIYNENSGKYFSRTVYRHSQLAPPHKMALAPEQKAVARQPRRSVSSGTKVHQPRYGRPAGRRNCRKRTPSPGCWCGGWGWWR